MGHQYSKLCKLLQLSLKFKCSSICLAMCLSLKYWYSVKMVQAGIMKYALSIVSKSMTLDDRYAL